MNCVSIAHWLTLSHLKHTTWYCVIADGKKYHVYFHSWTALVYVGHLKIQGLAPLCSTNQNKVGAYFFKLIRIMLHCITNPSLFCCCNPGVYYTLIWSNKMQEQNKDADACIKDEKKEENMIVEILKLKRIYHHNGKSTTL